ncbi:AraC family transcriptional regulator [Escherichia coli]|uniref:helix-turn-helix domain-containing protein n=1 Tax=Escherichia coli TaxID=562 RepID=UPI000BE51E86|nr:helix-turn-helix domain-containing protein [Escherichia coli]EFM6510985.1 AraC family transcriptional regulator [Escherichia coli]
MLKKMMVNSIIQHIEDNLENYFITIDCLAAFSGYSRRYLQFIFKEYMGIPVGKYIRMRRASRAAALLKLSKLSVLEISERLLYDSQQTFTREFRKIIGYTPMQYRNNSCWPLGKILGRKYIHETYPAPVFCYLDKRKVFGKVFEHKNLILYTGVDVKSRWGRAYKYLKQHKNISVSNRIPYHNKGDITARTILWTDEKDADCSITIEEGVYARFSFECRINDYMRFLYNIYYNSLPKCNLNKKDAYDIEEITISGVGSDVILTCDIYLPVYRGGDGVLGES